MKRFHVHVAVHDLQQSIRFYSSLFDPQGIAWESFHTLDSVPVYGSDTKIEAGERKAACCAPAA
jgi:catechol 2,3-dioxygenase-like lactoylglutathione lyase family enzyme